MAVRFRRKGEAMAEKRLGISDQLKSSITMAFGRQRDFAKQFEESFPAIQKGLIEMAQIQSGQEISVNSLAALSKDLTVIVESLQLLASKGKEAITEANTATMQLKEFEDDPSLIAEDLIDVATVLANADIWMQSSADFVGKTAELALPKVRRQAVADLSHDALRAWADDISDELRRRSGVG